MFRKDEIVGNAGTESLELIKSPESRKRTLRTGGANSYINIDPNKANPNSFGEKPDVATVDTFLNNAFANLAGYFNLSLSTMSGKELGESFRDNKDYIMNIINTNFYANPIKK